MSQGYRTREVMVSSAVYDACKALADVLGHSCVDEYIDVTIGKLLEQEKQLNWLVTEQRKRLKALSEEYRERIARNIPDEDKLP